MRSNLGVTPRTGWSIDPFGHGATVPYLLKAAGVSTGTIIQRIHYAWKQWLAERQMGDFMWRQGWDADGRTDLLTHNQPFDIYSIKHSCGPHPQVRATFLGLTEEPYFLNESKVYPEMYRTSYCLV